MSRGGENPKVWRDQRLARKYNQYVEVYRREITLSDTGGVSTPSDVFLGNVFCTVVNGHSMRDTEHGVSDDKEHYVFTVRYPSHISWNAQNCYIRYKGKKHQVVAIVELDQPTTELEIITRYK
jgi:hypothetical protein